MGKKSRSKAVRRETGVTESDRAKNQLRRSSGPTSAATSGSAPAQASRVGVSAAASRLIQKINPLLAQGKPEEALALLQKTAPAADTEVIHRALVAQCLMMLKQYAEAYPLLALTEIAGAGTADLWFARAEAEANLNLPTLAERNLRRLMQLRPKHPAAESIREFMRQNREARAELAESLGADPETLEEAMAMEEATFLPLREGDYQAVVDATRRAIEICPAYDPPHLTLAQALLLQDNVDEAIPVLSALSERPTVAGAQATRALVRLLVSMERSEEARRAAQRLFESASTPETRPLEAETLAHLNEDEEIIDLLASDRDLTPREQYLLAIARARTGDFASARRALDAALRAGLEDPLAARAAERLRDDRSDLPYFSVVARLSPAVTNAVTHALQNRTEESRARLRSAAEADNRLVQLLPELLEEDPVQAISLLGALGDARSLALLREFAQGDAGNAGDRLIALGELRDAGEIAEDEPVEIVIEGQPHTITLGRHRIVPDPPISMPSLEAAKAFDTAARATQQDAEAGYDLWLKLDEEYPTVAGRLFTARTCMALGRTDEAEEWFNKALEMDPSSAEAHISLALSRMTAGDLRGAMEEARAVDALESLTPQEILQYSSVRENLDTLLSSPLADALMQQADIAGDEETASMNREMADMLGGMQRSLALTQYLRQRPVTSLREDLTLTEVTQNMEGEVIQNAAWLFGLSTELEDIRQSTSEETGEEPEGDDKASDEDSGDDELPEAPETANEPFLNAARELLARELLDPDRLEEGLPGLPERDLDALRWLLDRGGLAPLDEYLKEYPPDPAAPGDMLLENGIVAEGRLGGKMTRMIPVDLRDPLDQALTRVQA